MAVCFRGLLGLPIFNNVSEPATLAQHWMTWRAEFKLLRGLATQLKREFFYFTLLDPDVGDISNNLIAGDVRYRAKDYDKAMDSLSEHFKLRENAPMRQNMLAAKSSAGETMNNFITCLQKRAEHCDYEGEQDKIEILQFLS